MPKYNEVKKFISIVMRMIIACDIKMHFLRCVSACLVHGAVSICATCSIKNKILNKNMTVHKSVYASVCLCVPVTVLALHAQF